MLRNHPRIRKASQVMKLNTELKALSRKAKGRNIEISEEDQIDIDVVTDVAERVRSPFSVAEHDVDCAIIMAKDQIRKLNDRIAYTPVDTGSAVAILEADSATDMAIAS